MDSVLLLDLGIKRAIGNKEAVGQRNGDLKYQSQNLFGLKGKIQNRV